MTDPQATARPNPSENRTAMPDNTARRKPSLRTAAKAGAVTLNKALSHLGVLVSPRHYYASAPDLRALAGTRAVWAPASELPGIDVDLDAQATWLRDTCTPFAAEYEGGRAYQEAAHLGPGYGFVEAQALHGILRALRPRRYLEVGSGVSTRLALAALDRNAADGHPGAVTCVEPYPHAWLAADPRVDLHRAPVQTVGTDPFTALEAGDVLFVDSSHVVKAGSDVNFLVLEVFPRLAPGVVVHVHDIYLPYDYQRDLLDTPFHWAETSLVRAYLTHNHRVRILACLSHLHYARPADLGKIFPDYVPQPGRDGLRLRPDAAGHFPSSLWFVTR
ncbi:class I SAM-dependent methyltransferase [Yinghuangia soli]|uniref:Class I SAM-dependent methyltransferase n=1 Tax=Yinghuangia soli TaxID=2908204 RepID=A0AA41Q0E2_9ACTN|nr:class I SAM-dependent methyltransferase [Yinghuangia soli]MCF2529264.1 class I SAM-dependent methyltransferase [Yinghuangia soli]